MITFLIAHLHPLDFKVIPQKFKLPMEFLETFPEFFPPAQFRKAQ